MHVVILERNKLVGRKVARLFASVGATVAVVEDPAQIAPVIGDANVICSDTFDADFVAEQVRSNKQLHGVLWTAEPMKRSLRHLVESARPNMEPGGLAPTGGIDHVLGRRDFESPPRAWEVLMVARRLISPTATAPLSAYLDWGFSTLELGVGSTGDRDAAVGKIGEFITALAVPRRIVDMFGELAHELLMNAIYDAPVDSAGRAKYAGDRKADVRLADEECPSVKLACDGSKLVLQIRDPFGRLERGHVIDGLARGLSGGEQDRSHGGAGLGFLVCHNSTSAMFFDVTRGRSTEVTALFELDMNLRELRTQAKSLHFWSRT